jgi:hypothetical protein
LTAEGLKSDLLKMLTLNKYSKVYLFIYQSWLVNEMRCFVTMLLHHNIKYLHMPSCVDWNEENKLEFEKLLEVIGFQCSGLKTFRFIDDWDSINDNPDDPALTEQSWYGRAFFRALPGLSSLRVLELDSYNSNDWALQQIGMHGQNIV